MSDPLGQIEDRKAQVDLGVVAFRIFTGAREEGASRPEAVLVVMAWFRAMLAGAVEDQHG